MGLATGLNINKFTLNLIAQEKSLALKELEDNLEAELEGLDDDQSDEVLDEVGEAVLQTAVSCGGTLAV